MSKKQNVLYALSEATFNFSEASSVLIDQKLELLNISDKEKGDLVQKIQKPNSSSRLIYYFKQI